MERFQCKSLRTLLGLLPSVKAETVRLLAGVEPMACRFSVLKANYFHRLRTSQKAVFKALIPHLVRHRKLVGCFDLNHSNANSKSEWVNITKNSFVGLIENILFKFGLSHEFHTNAFQTRQDFDKLVKSVFRRYYFDKHAAG